MRKVLKKPKARIWLLYSKTMDECIVSLLRWWWLFVNLYGCINAGAGDGNDNDDDIVLAASSYTINKWKGKEEKETKKGMAIFGEKQKKEMRRGDKQKRETNLKDVSKTFLHWRFLVYVQWKVEWMRSEGHRNKCKGGGVVMQQPSSSITLSTSYNLHLHPSFAEQSAILYQSIQQILTFNATSSMYIILPRYHIFVIWSIII